MRFSDMMGSGAEQDPKPSISESEAAIAAALAPYLDAAPPEPEPVAPAVAPPVLPLVASQVVQATADPAGIEPAAPAAPAAPTAPAAPVTPRPPAAPAAVTAPVAAPVVEYAPLSDDLLPHRR